MWQKVKRVLGILTDALTYGRERGWWFRKPGPPAAPTLRAATV
jgi:hypothetical protein